jgi:flagellar hook assembly protein FlgD
MTTGGVKAVDELSIDVYPNPFTRQTDIRYQIPDNREHIVLKIYDITGREVKDFEGQLSVTGHQVSVVWDGRDDQNRLLGSGIYFLMSNQRGSAVKIVKSE